MKISLSEQTYNNEIPYRAISDEDSTLLGKLMFEGYLNNRLWRRNTSGGCRGNNKNIRGAICPFLHNCSFVIEEDSLPMAATIITLFNGIHIYRKLGFIELEQEWGYAYLIIINYLKQFYGYLG